jgi:hypothetical protein
MKTFNPSFFILVIGSTLFSACTSQKYVSTETDDIYFSSADRHINDDKDFNQVTEVSGEDYKSTSARSSSDYFSIGKEKAQTANPKAEVAYSNSTPPSYDYSGEQTGGVTNNFYGSTNYYEDDGYDDSYATRIRRFNNTNVSLGYGYYSPFYTDPFWNYGFGYAPYSGLNIGYSSYYGWNAGYNFGFGFGYPYFGYNNRPFYGNYWNPYGCYGNFGYGNFGYGGYSPYWNGYYRGYYDGNITGNAGGLGSTNQRGIISGKKPSAIGEGFSENVANDGRRNSASQSRSAATPTGSQTGAQGTQSTAVDSRRNVSTATDTRSASVDRVTRANSIYQVNDRRSADQNIKSSEASTRYQTTTRREYATPTRYSIQNDRTTTSAQTGVQSNDRVSSNVPIQNTRSQERGSSYSGSNRTTYQRNNSSESYSNRSSQPAVLNDQTRRSTPAKVNPSTPVNNSNRSSNPSYTSPQRGTNNSHSSMNRSNPEIYRGPSGSSNRRPSSTRNNTSSPSNSGRMNTPSVSQPSRSAPQMAPSRSSSPSPRGGMSPSSGGGSGRTSGGRR